MAYCTNCGALLDPSARYCPECGTKVVAATIANSAVVRSDYKVVLISRGSCTKSVAIDILNDLLGYTDAEAAQIINNVPMATAIDLTMPQAQYIAQAMSEFGMEVAIYNDNGYVNMDTARMTSVFDDNGSFLSNVIAVLAGITIGNRITRFEKWVKPAPAVFRPVYRRQMPLTGYRRYRPAPTVRPVPAPKPVAVPRPTMRPAPAVRPVPAQPVRPGAARPIPASPAKPGAARPIPASPAKPGAARPITGVPGRGPANRGPGGRPGPDGKR